MKAIELRGRIRRSPAVVRHNPAYRHPYAAPVPNAGEAAEGEVADMPGGAAQKTAATIADRFKLDAPDPKAAKAAMASKKATTIALTAAIVALALAGILTFVLYQHWEFLKGA